MKITRIAIHRTHLPYAGGAYGWGAGNAIEVAQSTPRRLLRCALDPRSMVSTRIAEFDAPVINGGATAPDLPGLGVTPNQNAIGAPVAIYDGA